MGPLVELAPGDVTPEVHVDGVPAWDSMSHLRMVLELEMEFGVAFSPAQIGEMLSVALILEALDKQGAR